jgi:hypothetical protein
MLSWPIAFGITLLVETPIYLGLLASRLGVWAVLGASLLVNALTHPAMWFGGLALFGPFDALQLAGAELVVWLVEWGVLVVLFRVLSRRNVGVGELALTAAAANLASTLVGLLL